MPFQHRYDASLIKKRYCGGASFWPRISETMALRLHNAYIARSKLIPTWKIMDELSHLEMPGARQASTKAAAPMRGPILGRFIHTHYSGAAFLGKNLFNQWFEGYGSKHRLLEKEIERVAFTEQSEPIKFGQIAHFYAIEGYQRKARRQQLTGEWIVYYVHKGLNYYLDIAFHEEAETAEGEQALYERLKEGCAWEFPFAFED